MAFVSVTPIRGGDKFTSFYFSFMFGVPGKTSLCITKILVGDKKKFADSTVVWLSMFKLTNTVKGQQDHTKANIWFMKPNHHSYEPLP